MQLPVLAMPWIYQFVFIVTVRRVALFICVEINVTRLRRKGEMKLKGAPPKTCFLCTQAVCPINIAAVPRNPSQCGAFIFLFVHKKRKLKGFREKSMIVLFSIFLNIEPWEPGFVQNRTENQNKFAFFWCGNLLLSKENGVSKHGTIAHFAIIQNRTRIQLELGFLFWPQLCGFTHLERIIFKTCLFLCSNSSRCVTYLQQHETVNMFETKNIDAQHGSSCEFYNVAVLICSLPTPGSRIFNMFDVPRGSMPSLCQPHAFQVLDAKKNQYGHQAPFPDVSSSCCNIFFQQKKGKNAHRHGGPQPQHHRLDTKTKNNHKIIEKTWVDTEGEGSGKTPEKTPEH